jgi:hypothetical protein
VLLWHEIQYPVARCEHNDARGWPLFVIGVQEVRNKSIGSQQPASRQSHTWTREERTGLAGRQSFIHPSRVYHWQWIHKCGIAERGALRGGLPGPEIKIVSAARIVWMPE